MGTSSLQVVFKQSGIDYAFAAERFKHNELIDFIMFASRSGDSPSKSEYKGTHSEESWPVNLCRIPDQLTCCSVISKSLKTSCSTNNDGPPGNKHKSDYSCDVT